MADAKNCQFILQYFNFFLPSSFSNFFSSFSPRLLHTKKCRCIHIRELRNNNIHKHIYVTRFIKFSIWEEGKKYKKKLLKFCHTGKENMSGVGKVLGIRWKKFQYFIQFLCYVKFHITVKRCWGLFIFPKMFRLNFLCIFFVVWKKVCWSIFVRLEKIWVDCKWRPSKNETPSLLERSELLKTFLAVPYYIGGSKSLASPSCYATAPSPSILDVINKAPFIEISPKNQFQLMTSLNGLFVSDKNKFYST